MVKRLFYTVTAFCFLLPIVLTVKKSFSDDMTVFTLNEYNELLFNCFSFYQAFWNSVIYSAVITVAVLFIIIPAAFVFTQIKSRAMDVFFIFLIILMLMPLQV